MNAHRPVNPRRFSREEVLTDYRAHADIPHTLFTPRTSQTPRGPIRSPRVDCRAPDIAPGTSQIFNTNQTTQPTHATNSSVVVSHSELIRASLSHILNHAETMVHAMEPVRKADDQRLASSHSIQKKQPLRDVVSRAWTERGVLAATARSGLSRRSAAASLMGRKKQSAPPSGARIPNIVMFIGSALATVVTHTRI